jgi:UDP-glucose 4-epimerase
MKILVTGGAGFIGSHVADALVAEGHEVHVVDDLSGGFVENVSAEATLHTMDVRTEAAADLVRAQRFDAMVHHAAQMDVRRSVEDPLFDAGVNVLGFLNLMEAARATDLKKVVFASTGGAIYGEPDYVPQDEQHPIRPISPYGITKRVTELYLDFYRQIHNIEYVALRYANVYGPRQNPHGEAGVVAIFIRKMLEGENAIINGDGLQTRDYVFVGDVVRANLAALNYGQSGIFNIGTGVETNVNELFRWIRELTGSDIPETHIDPKAGEQMRSVLGTERANRDLGWMPEYSIEDGLRATVDWFRGAVGNEDPV